MQDIPYIIYAAIEVCNYVYNEPVITAEIIFHDWTRITVKIKLTHFAFFG